MSAGSELIVDQVNITGGLVIAMMTTSERDAYFNSPDVTGKGALIYNKTTGYMEFYDGVEWTPTKAGRQVDFS